MSSTSPLRSNESRVSEDKSSRAEIALSRPRSWVGDIGGRDRLIGTRASEIVTAELLAGESLVGYEGSGDGRITASVQCGISGGGIAVNNVRGDGNTGSGANVTNKSAGIARLRGATTYTMGTERAGAAAEAARTKMATQDARIVL